MKKKSIVTGALGFIGSHLVDLLVDQNHDVLGIDDLSGGFHEYKNPKAEYQIQKAEDFSNYGNFDIIFHLAAWPRIQPSFDDFIGHDSTNIGLTLKIIESFKTQKKKPKLVFVSSSSVYGNTEIYPTHENVAVDPLNPYALQKYTSERYVCMLGERYGFEYACLRLFNVFGKRSFHENSKSNAYSPVAGIFKAQCLKGGPLTITGDGKQTRDFVHVSDVCTAFLAAALHGKGVYNVGRGENISILELAQIFSQKYKTEITHIPERKGESQTTLADISAIQKIGWSPKITLKKAIEEDLL